MFYYFKILKKYVYFRNPKNPLKKKEKKICMKLNFSTFLYKLIKQHSPLLFYHKSTTDY